MTAMNNVRFVSILVALCAASLAVYYCFPSFSNSASDRKQYLRGRGLSSPGVVGHGDDDGEWWDGDDHSDGGGEYTCEELRVFYGKEYDEGPCAKKIDLSWTNNIPRNMSAIKNVGMDCQKPCMMEKLSDPNASWSGTCDGFCGKGNACCKFNDPLAPKECTGVAPEAFMDEHGDVKQMMIRCTWPKEAPPGKSNYQKFKDAAWKEAMDILGGRVPTKMSTLSVPNLDLPTYSKTEGRADTSAFLAMGQDSNGWTANCPAFGNPAYKLANNGLFPNMTYYKYPFYIKYPDLKVDLFCGARYTDDPSLKTVENAAKMAQKACDDMGDKCGGFAVGADPECCSSKELGEPGAGCTEVVFLNPSAKTASIDKKPCSIKTCKWQLNYVTYTKN